MKSICEVVLLSRFIMEKMLNNSVPNKLYEECNKYEIISSTVIISIALLILIVLIICGTIIAIHIMKDENGNNDLQEALKEYFKKNKNNQ